MDDKKENAEVTPPQDPSQKEKQPERTEADKAAFSLKKNAERAKELGLDPEEVLGLKKGKLADDEVVTVGKLREMEMDKAHKSALQMADDLPESERTKVKELLETRIRPSGNAEEDLRLARAAVNAEHNAGIVELLSKRGNPTRNAAGGSGGAPQEEDFTPTGEEAVMMRPPYSLSKEKIIAARKKQG